MRGRRPVNNAIKDLRGTLKPSRMRAGLKLPVLTQAPPPPPWFNPYMKKMYRVVCANLIEAGIIAVVDMPLVHSYCIELAELKTAMEHLQTPEDHIDVSQSGYKQPSPWIAIKNQSIKHLRELGACFGFDPLSRSRFDVEPEKGESEFEALMREIDEISDEQILKIS